MSTGECRGTLYKIITNLLVGNECSNVHEVYKVDIDFKLNFQSKNLNNDFCSPRLES